MTNRRSQTLDDLRYAVANLGADSLQARAAAIAYCEARGINPHFRHAVFPKFTIPPSFDQPVGPVDVPSIEQWEIELRRALGETAATDGGKDA
jgi:hypothetical protein